MTTVIGLDLSLVCTGLTRIDHKTRHGTEGTEVRTQLVTSRGHRTDHRSVKGARIRGIRDNVMTRIPRNTSLVVLEGISYASNNPGTDERHHLWWLISDACDHLGIPLTVCPPSTLKKFTTDNGAAKKAAVVAAVARMWPHVDLPTDDAADSLGLATIGAQHTHIPLPFPVLERHKLALTKIEWPQLQSNADTVKDTPDTANQDRQKR
jgi:crossover junction endodeoxyribonuclease RuvC